jgi:hypothetical protein
MGSDSKSAIHEQVRAGDEGGTVGSQIQRRLCDIGGRSAPPNGMQCGRLIGHRLRVGGVAQIFFPEARVDVSRANSIDTNSPGGEFEGQIACQSDHAGLRARVRNGVGKCMAGVNRADVYDCSAGLVEQRKYRLC